MIFFRIVTKIGALRIDSNTAVMLDSKLADCLRRLRNNGNAMWPCFIIRHTLLPIPTAEIRLYCMVMALYLKQRRNTGISITGSVPVTYADTEVKEN
jgi:hypothetical protein